MSVYISPNLTKKKTEYKPSDKIIYLNYYFQRKKLRIPSEVTVLFKDWDKNWKQGRKSDPILKSDLNHISKNILLKQKLSKVNQIIDRIKLVDSVFVIKKWACRKKFGSDKKRVRLVFRGKRFVGYRKPKGVLV